jgi:NADPH2:quinone reductase
MQRKLPRHFLTNARRTSTEPIEIKYGISTGNCSWKMTTGGSCALSIKTKMEIRAMQAWLCSDPVGYESLAWQEVPTPTPAPGEVLVNVRAAGLNFADLLIVQHKYQHKPALPFVPGFEYAGVVSAVGDGVTTVSVGQKVACLTGTGGFATQAVAPAEKCLVLSPDFDLVDAAAYIMTYATSWHALMDRGQLKAGETVLVLGAAGGVGTAAIQIAKAAGARVIAAASSKAKCDLCTSLGADVTIDYSEQSLANGFREALKAATDGRGPDVVYDPVGGEFVEPTFRSIAWRGRYLVIGFAAGGIPRLPINLALLKGASLVGVFWGEFERREPDDHLRMMNKLGALYAQGLIKPFIGRTLPMSELQTAYAEMGSRGVTGKLVLVN